MSEQHRRRRAAEWFLTLHELPREQALTLARPALEPPHQESLGQTLYDTGLGTEEGL